MDNEILIQYKKYRIRNARFIVILLVLLAAIALLALIAGSHQIGWSDLWALVRGEGIEMNRQIILNIRLPRILATIVTGIILSISGAIMQILLRNPLASPYTLGISNAAAFGASFGIVFLGAGTGIARSSDLFMITNPYIVTISAFLGSLLGLAIILLIIKIRQASVETIILRESSSIRFSAPVLPSCNMLPTTFNWPPSSSGTSATWGAAIGANWFS